MFLYELGALDLDLANDNEVLLVRRERLLSLAEDGRDEGEGLLDGFEIQLDGRLDSACRHDCCDGCEWGKWTVTVTVTCR